ncbi:helix-turn-helix domain-containing protein [Bacillaceae bacterium SIJ1]|uniref:helix-turn-helix domain-containing protein n=1 Tax=Litoribacterium kuwaitense TaxID=1398745 RepID=UPI0013EABD12|nr:helix-turn-helix domain-containing protein [Litoribacterium kuwaitense]NGP46284.1 helix-turn-helix domain-containing protein [Litoribacterium kuwaitense]
MNRTWFRRMLMGYTPAFFIIIVVLFLLFFQVLNEQSRKEALKVNESLAGQAFRYIDNTLKEIDHRVLRESLVNKNLQQFLDEEDSAKVPINLEALKSLQELKIAYPIIDSAYILRSHDEMVLSLATLAKLSDYGDRSFIQTVMTNQIPQWTNERKFKEFSNQLENEVISLVRQVPFYTKTKGFIVVNVSTKQLETDIQNMYDSEVSFIRLMDREGNALFQENDKVQQGEVLTSFTSDYSGLTIESGFTQSNMSRIVDSINFLWLLLSIFVVIIGILWIIYITKKTYKPLEQLVGKVRSYAKDPNGAQNSDSHANEFTFINYTLEQMMAQSNVYLQEREEALLLRRKYTFEKILKEIGPFPDWEEEMNSIELPVSFAPSIVFMVEIDRYKSWKEQMEEQDLLHFKASMEKRASQMKGGIVSILWCGWTNESRLVGIAQGLDDKTDPLPYLERYKEQIVTFSSFTVTIGYSKMIVIPEDLRRGYREAEEALAYKAVEGGDQIIRYENVTHTEVDIYSHLKLAHEVVLTYRKSPNHWREQYRQLFVQMRKTKLRKEELVNIMNFFVYYLEREKHLFPQELMKQWNDYTLPGLVDQLERFDTVDELESNLLLYLADLSDQLVSYRQSRNHHQVLSEIKAYIESHYDKEELSLDHLSDVFDLKGKYISKLFKDEFGEKFVDFLIRIRMERAEELLTTTSDPIVDISEQVGYVNANSFARIFRKMYGTSPGEYRKLRKDLPSA